MPNQSYIHPDGHYGPDVPEYVPQPGDNGYVPPTNPATPEVPTPAVIPNPNEQTAEERANALLEGYQSPMSAEDIATRQQQERDRLAAQADAIFGPQIENARRIGEKRISSTEGQFGVVRGLGMSTAEIGFMNNVQKQIDDQIMEITNAKAEYIATGNFQAQQRADAALEELRTSKNNLILKKAELIFQFMSEDRQQTTLDLQTISTLSDLPSGQKITIGGKTYEGLGSQNLDPFFSGSNIIELMKSLPAGAKQTIIDPNTGAEWNIEGIASADPDLLITKNIDNAGNETIVARNKTTGEIMWSARDTGVGKTKSSGSGSGGTSGKFTQLFGQASSALEATRGQDGKLNTAQYLDWMRRYREADPIRGLQYFITDFPINNLNLTNDQGALDFVNSLEGLKDYDTGSGDENDDAFYANLYGYDSVEAYQASEDYIPS